MSIDALNAIDADAAALATASMLAEDALALHREAEALLAEGWSSESGCAAGDLLRQQIADGTELVAALHDAAEEFRSLRGVVEESGSVPDLSQTAVRLNERPTPSLQAPAPQPSYAGSAAWPSSVPPVPPLPDLAGALVGLVATAADALSPDSVDPSGSPPDDAPDDAPVGPPADPPDEKAGPTPRAAVVGEPITPPPPASVPPTPAVPEWPQPQPQPEPPLLAAERPPESDPIPAPEPPPVPPQSPAEPAPPRSPAEQDPSTPCEIAADELPQVGQ